MAEVWRGRYYVAKLPGDGWFTSAHPSLCSLFPKPSLILGPLVHDILIHKKEVFCKVGTYSLFLRICDELLGLEERKLKMELRGLERQLNG